MKIMNKKGFTLVEIMIVVIIIGILVAMVAPRFAGRSDEARSTAARTDIQANIAAALDLYEMDMGHFPTTESGLRDLLKKPSDSDVSTRWKGPYLKKKPIDPWNHPYVYRTPSLHEMDYDLYSMGKDGKEGGGDDINNWDEEKDS